MAVGGEGLALWQCRKTTILHLKVTFCLGFHYRSWVQALQKSTLSLQKPLVEEIRRAVLNTTARGAERTAVDLRLVR